MSSYIFRKYDKTPPRSRPAPSLPSENRYGERHQCKLQISLKEVGSNKEIEAQSVNVSRSGIGINLKRKLYIGKRLELWIHLKDGLDPIHRFGKLIWLHQIDPFLYSAGIKFISSIDSYIGY